MIAGIGRRMIFLRMIMGSGGSRASGGAPVTHVTELAAIIQPIIGAAATIQPIIQIIESAPDAGSRAPSCLEKRLARRACFACSFGYLMNTPAAVFSLPVKSNIRSGHIW